MEGINCIEGFPFDNDKQLLVTLDVASLYTSIPQTEALEIAHEVLNAGKDHTGYQQTSLLVY